MKKNTIIQFIATGMFLFGATACTGNFEDYNKNPHEPDQNDMGVDWYLVRSLALNLQDLMMPEQENFSQYVDCLMAGAFSGYVADSNLGTGWSGRYATYNPSDDWKKIPFNDFYSKFYPDYFNLKNQSDDELFLSLAELYRIVVMLRVTDTYGPIPYSKINGTAYTVAYDSMEELYNQMFADLEDGISIFKAALASGADVSTLADFDYVYGGNFTKWVKYANTLKLRMAMRIVNVAPALSKEKAEEAVNDSYGVMAEAGDAAFSSFNDGMNPFYRAAYTWNGGEFRASANITSYLGGYKDPRLTIYVKESEENGYVGVRNGISQTASSFASYQKLSNVNVGEGDKLLVMSAAEAYFLRAEGALRGWNMGGTAKELYETGIAVSMAEKGASVGDYLSSKAVPEAYTDPVNSKYNVVAASTICPAYDEMADFEVNLERIMVQKWIASYPSGWETWADIRRTGYPKLFPVGNNLSGGVVNTDRGMRRLPYPQSEYNTNLTNVNAAVGMLGGADNAGTDLWWAKKN